MIDYKPSTKPKITLEELRERLKAVDFLDAFEKTNVALVGIRGYYKQSLGVPSVNDRVFYDDALILTNQESIFETYNFNVDPSITRKGVAVLAGNEIYDVVRHAHKGRYPALQIVKDKLIRDGAPDKFDIGRHGINFHYDTDDRSRWSLGCQTLPRSQWAAFQRTVYNLFTEYRLSSVKYFLIEN